MVLPEPGLVSVSGPGETYPALSDPALALRRPPVGGPLPASFWSRLRPHPWFSRFPRQPGSAACAIPSGGPPGEPSLRGRCATTLFDLSPGRQVVALSESWQGPGVRTAAWAFVLAPGGHILRATVVGAPPQSRR